MVQGSTVTLPGLGPVISRDFRPSELLPIHCHPKVGKWTTRVLLDHLFRGWIKDSALRRLDSERGEVALSKRRRTSYVIELKGEKNEEQMTTLVEELISLVTLLMRVFRVVPQETHF